MRQALLSPESGAAGGDAGMEQKKKASAMKHVHEMAQMRVMKIEETRRTSKRSEKSRKFGVTIACSRSGRVVLGGRGRR